MGLKPDPDHRQKRSRETGWGGSLLGSLARGAMAICVLLLAWQAAIVIFQPRPFLFPAPVHVLEVFAEQPGYLARNAWITVKEMLAGLGVGITAGLGVALLLSRVRVLDRMLTPFVTVTQTLPVFAIAPLLVIWFGFGMGSKIVMAALIIFFPVATAFQDGLARTPRHWLDLGRSWGASEGQIYRYLRIPAALPQLMSGVKIAATVAPIGAVVGEWAGASGGLGYVMLQANARTQTDIVFAALLVLALCAFALRQLAVLAADRVVWWADRSELSR